MPRKKKEEIFGRTINCECGKTIRWDAPRIQDDDPKQYGSCICGLRYTYNIKAQTTEKSVRIPVAAKNKTISKLGFDMR